MKKTIASLTLFSCLLLSPLMWAQTAAKKTASEQWQLLDEVNKYRQSHHLKPLKMNAYMSQLATQHSVDMATKRMGFGHRGFNTRIKYIYQRIKLCRQGAENVAYFKVGPRVVVHKWLTSPGHRRNIEGNYNLTGVGIARDKRGWIYYTQIFVRTDSPI